MENKNINELVELFELIKKKIIERLDDFKKKWKFGTEEDIFAELIFCILTPQSKAMTCWRAVEAIVNKKLLYTVQKNKISDELIGVRFKYKKTDFIIEAREQFILNDKINIKEKLQSFDNVFLMRKWLIDNVKGYGYKEASHFLRNIGFGRDIAILDRHILRNLVFYNVIDEKPKSMSSKLYLDIEKKMQSFANKINIDLDCLDVLFWYKETNTIFK